MCFGICFPNLIRSATFRFYFGELWLLCVHKHVGYRVHHYQIIPSKCVYLLMYTTGKRRTNTILCDSYNFIRQIVSFAGKMASVEATTEKSISIHTRVFSFWNGNIFAFQTNAVDSKVPSFKRNAQWITRDAQVNRFEKETF